MSDSKVMVLSNVINKSEYDFRDYKIIRLKNGLEALIVHDPAISSKHKSEEENGKRKLLTAAVALTIGVGSLDSPTEVYGLPHLIEHVYSPKSDEENNGFRDFISEHGGFTNACTTAEYTTHHFDIREKYLKAALERFANCFIKPVIEEAALEAEVEAIDSEFCEEKDNQGRILECLRSHTLKQSHLYHNVFHCGNKQSLMRDNDCGDLREKVLKFHRENYHGTKMKLVVIGGEPLEVLQGWVLESFSGITKSPRKKVKVPTGWRHSKKKKRRLSRSDDEAFVSWALPSLRKVYEHKPEEYVSYLLNQEGKGSLISLLKSKGWILSLKSGVNEFGIQRTSKDYIFVIEIDLTDFGLLEVNNIIGFIYAYLHLFRDSPQEWIFEEIQTIGNMKFNFEDENQLNYAIRLSENMLFYPPEHIISATYVCKKWDEEMIKQVIGYLIPENMRVDHLISDFTRKDDVQCVPWYGTQYYVETIDETSMKLWKEHHNLHESFKFPAENDFIPRDISIHVGDTSNKENSTSLKCIVQEQRMKFWFKKDIISKILRTCIFIRINFKGTHNTAKNSALSELFLSILHYRLSEVKFKAKISMCDISLLFVNGMLEMKFFSFNAMLRSVLSDILFEVGSFKPADDGQYKMIKQDLERYLSNNGNEILELLLHEHLYENREMLHHLDELLLDDFRRFIEDMRSQLFIEVLCHGSLTEEEANGICSIIKENLQGTALPIKSRYAAERVMCLPSKANIVMSFRPSSEIDTNSVAELYFQIGKVESKSVKLPALLNLFHDVVQDAFFQNMRTEENLGYTVESSITTRQKVMGYSFKIVSHKYGPYYLQNVIEKFIEQDLGAFLRDLDHKRFKNCRNSAVEELSGNCHLSKKKLKTYGHLLPYIGLK
ncbi:Insulinase (Peptidase family M16) family protein [Trifolium repens]|nr:Insulinase (Peptidase family M16) family protein [Trifolium repens]